MGTSLWMHYREHTSRDLTTMGGDVMVTAEKQYNGWSNIETWNVQLWISNTEPLYKLVKRLMGNASGSVTTGEFADSLEGFLWILWDGKTPDGYRLNPVNWVEIATSWQEDFKEYLDELDESGNK